MKPSEEPVEGRRWNRDRSLEYHAGNNKNAYSTGDNRINHGSDCQSSVNARKENHKISQRKSVTEFVPHFKWLDLAGILFVHLGCLYGLYLLAVSKSLKNYAWVFLTLYTSGFGITAGAHRLWSHRAYKAKFPLQFILLILFTITGQRSVYAWVLDHRVHHKYSETNADPHNAKRGFVFAHVGWIVLTPHPDVVDKRTKVDMSDLEANSLIMWQDRYYVPLFFVFVIALPVLLPCYLWNEPLWTSFWIHFNARYCITLNIAFCVNSVAHLWGPRPYDKNINPSESLTVSIAALGEGWHNYHHVFPYDYKTGELGDYGFNLTTGFIDFFAKIGWAYDRKSVSKEMIRSRMKKTGDGSIVRE